MACQDFSRSLYTQTHALHAHSRIQNNSGMEWASWPPPKKKNMLTAAAMQAAGVFPFSSRLFGTAGKTEFRRKKKKIQTNTTKARARMSSEWQRHPSPLYFLCDCITCCRYMTAKRKKHRRICQLPGWTWEERQRELQLAMALWWFACMERSQGRVAAKATHLAMPVHFCTCIHWLGLNRWMHLLSPNKWRLLKSIF